jgi:methionyl-tRNA formyltransferase
VSSREDLCGFSGERVHTSKKDALVIATADSAVEIEEIQRPGKARMTAGQFLQGMAQTG